MRDDAVERRKRLALADGNTGATGDGAADSRAGEPRRNDGAEPRGNDGAEPHRDDGAELAAQAEIRD